MREKRQFDFVRRWEVANRQRTGRDRRSKVSMFVLGACVLGLGAAAPWLWAYKQELELRAVEQRIAALSAIDSQLAKLQALHSEITSQQQILDQIRSKTTDPAPVLDRLRTLLPVGTAVTSFSMQADKSVTLVVSVPTPVDVARLLTSIQGSGWFQGADIKTVSLQDKSQSLSLNLKLK